MALFENILNLYGTHQDFMVSHDFLYIIICIYIYHIHLYIYICIIHNLDINYIKIDFLCVPNVGHPGGPSDFCIGDAPRGSP